MAHELDFTTGDAAIAYRGETPWHGYGFQMPENAPIEDWLKAARLEWTVNERRVMTRPSDANLDELELPLVALLRSDNNGLLSVVSEKYHVVQPRDVMEFFRDLVADQGFQIETAGALMEGRRVWALASTGATTTLGDKDVLKAYLLLATSYDKKFSTTAQFTAVRVVCNNTLALSLATGNEASSVFRLPHTAAFEPAAAKAHLGLLTDQWSAFTGVAGSLSETPISEEDAVRFFLDLTGRYDETATIDEQMATNLLARRLLDSYRSSPGADFKTADGTLWGLVNAVSHFTDHARRAQNNGSRLNSAWFGQSALLKKAAWDGAVALWKKLQA